MKKSIFLLLLMMIVGCSGEDACFSKKGNAVSQEHALTGFHTIDIPMNVSAEIIPSEEYKLEIHSFENRIDALSFSIKDSVLIIKNDVSCSMLKSYETALLKIHSPTLKEIHSRTQFRVFSSDTLRYPDLFLFSSIPNQESASTHFDLKINNKRLAVEDNQIAFFELKGRTNFLDIGFYGANSALDARHLIAKKINVYHRSNQNIHLYPKNNIQGTIASVGHIYLYHKPDTLNINRLYTGEVIYK
ncbi:MAG TPA: DUF2807 domain-containing protein [Flavobacterium sp.]|nr:DUF2807 domain-containing protein [Flavobacterium sp.]